MLVLASTLPMCHDGLWQNFVKFSLQLSSFHGLYFYKRIIHDSHVSSEESIANLIQKEAGSEKNMK